MNQLIDFLCSCEEDLYLFCTAELKLCEERYHNMNIPDEDQVSAYFRIRQQLENLSTELRNIILKPVYLLPFLQPGRLVRVSRER